MTKTKPNPRKVCIDRGLTNYHAYKGAEAYMQAMCDDLLAMINTAHVRPLHERIAEYLKG